MTSLRVSTPFTLPEALAVPVHETPDFIGFSDSSVPVPPRRMRDLHAGSRGPIPKVGTRSGDAIIRGIHSSRNSALWILRMEADGLFRSANVRVSCEVGVAVSGILPGSRMRSPLGDPGSDAGSGTDSRGNSGLARLKPCGKSGARIVPGSMPKGANSFRQGPCSRSQPLDQKETGIPRSPTRQFDWNIHKHLNSRCL